MQDINLIRKMAWSFSKTTNAEYEELLSEAAIAYLEALESYDPSKSKLSTWTWRIMRNRLADFTAKETKVENRERTVNELEYRTLYGSQTNRMAGGNVDVEASSASKYSWEDCMDFGPGNAPTQEQALYFKEIMSELSEEAKEVCKMIFEAPHQFLAHAPKLSRGVIKDQLRQRGWKWASIWRSFREIKQALNETKAL